MKTKSGTLISTSFDITEKQPHRHQGEGNGEAQHNEEEEEEKLGEAQRAVAHDWALPSGVVAGTLAGNISALRYLARQRLGVLLRRGGEDGLLHLLDVGEPLRPNAGTDALNAAHHLDQPLQQQQQA